MTHDHGAEAIEVHFGKTDDGKWVAATCVAPFFFVEVDTEEEAHACALDAIRLYGEFRDKARPELTPDRGQAEHFPSSLTHVTTEVLYA